MFAFRRVFSHFGNKFDFDDKFGDCIIRSKTKYNQTRTFIANVAYVENNVYLILDVGIGFDL